MPTFAERLAAIRSGGTSFDEKLAALRSGPSVADKARARLEARGIVPGSQVDPADNSGPGFLRGVVDQLIPSRETLSEVASMLNLRGPVEQVKAVGRAVTGAVGAQVDQARKAKDSYLSAAQTGDIGQVVEGIGHSAAAATPFIGPAAASAAEEIKAGNIEYGLGKGVGLIADTLIPGVGGRKARTMQEAAPATILKAESDYADIFGHSAKTRAIADRTVPEMMDRNMRFSDPKEMAATANDSANAIDIEQIIQPGQTIPTRDILDQIEAAKAAEFNIVNGNQVPKAPESFAIAKALDDYGEIIRGHDVNGAIDAKRALDLRQRWEERVGKFYGRDDLLPGGAAEARMEAADALRDPINQIPGVGPANAEKHFQINVQKLGEAAPQSKTMGKVAAEVGTMFGAGALVHAIPGVGPLVGGLTMGGAAIKAIREIPKTPAWRTVSALHRRNFAKALQSGDYATAAQMAGAFTSGALIADEFGYPEAVASLRQEASASPGNEQQVSLRKAAVYRAPDGSETPVPRGIVTAFAQQQDKPDNPLAMWLTAMGKQGKIKPGGQLIFIDR